MPSGFEIFVCPFVCPSRTFKLSRNFRATCSCIQQICGLVFVLSTVHFCQRVSNCYLNILSIYNTTVAKQQQLLYYTKLNHSCSSVQCEIADCVSYWLPELVLHGQVTGLVPILTVSPTCCEVTYIDRQP